MKRFTVVYHLDAEENLIAIWTAGPDRDAVTIAANKADQLLAADPETASKRLSRNLNRLEISPLRFFCTIRPDDC